MTIDTPTWLQNGTYSARLDRIFSDVLFTEGVLRPGAGQLLVSPSSPAAMSVSVAAGYAAIQGDDIADQGKYLVRSTAAETVTITAAPGANSRIDLIVLRVNDPDAGGPAGNNATLVAIAGTPAASPSPPALPASAIPLAQVLVAAGTTAITAGMITDVRGQSQTFLANTLTNAGDLLSFDGANTVRVPAGISGYPLTSTGSAVAYAQLGTTGLANSAVTAAKLASNSVETAKIVDNAVTTPKIADGSITAAKLAAGISTRVGCELSFTGSLSYSGSGQATISTWTEIVDTANFYTSGGNATIPTGLDGLYLITLTNDAGSISTVTKGIIVIGGQEFPLVSGFYGASSGTPTNNTMQRTLTAGTTIGVKLAVNSGATFTVTGYNVRLIITRLG